MTKIEWTGLTWNPVVGCEKVSPGCKNCYAERFAVRLAGIKRSKHKYIPVVYKGKWSGGILMDFDDINKPAQFKNKMIFVCSMGDLFYERVDFPFIDLVFDSMFKNDSNIYQILTKRPERAIEYLRHLDKVCFEVGDPTCWSQNPNKNIWFGTSIEDQLSAHRRVPLLLKIPAFVRFLSIEPMIDRVDLLPILKLNIEFYRPETGYDGINWIIVGGESGNNARPLNPGWVKEVKNLCNFLNIPFFFKGWGHWLPDDQLKSLKGNHQLFSKTIDGVEYYNVGKKYSGDLLDGEQWHQFPGNFEIKK
jgi:protein gp37